ncbi:esterase [Brucella cytisi]|uniref:Esterase n=1 Tax=Brucella cytisi TaxID=407152 RepID=A0A1J6HL63_9HYPH|nr:esterase [Brucella cytisi]
MKCQRRFPVWGAILLLSVSVVGCGHPTGVMNPIASENTQSNSRSVDMLVVTTRQPSGDPNTLFNGERAPKAHLTDIAVSIPKQREPGSVQWPRKLPPDPLTDFAVTRARSVATVSDGKQWIKSHISNGKALVFVHGFNNRYEDSVFRFAQIVHDSQMDATPVLFTWPSRAKLTAYEYDRESTNYSRTALEQTIQTLVKDQNVKDITVLAHSMGTWLAMESLRQIGIRGGHVSPKVRNVILASPDIDVQVFAKQFAEMGKPRPKFTIFVSQDDRALAASRLLTGGVQRAGAIDPTQEPYRSQLETAGITAIDLTKVDTGDRLNHGKFAESPEIVQLIGQRLIAGQTLTDTRISLGEGVVAVVGGTVRTVGNVAGTAVAAPLTITERHDQKPGSTNISETFSHGGNTPLLN